MQVLRGEQVHRHVILERVPVRGRILRHWGQQQLQVGCNLIFFRSQLDTLASRQDYYCLVRRIYYRNSASSCSMHQKASPHVLLLTSPRFNISFAMWTAAKLSPFLVVNRFFWKSCSTLRTGTLRQNIAEYSGFWLRGRSIWDFPKIGNPYTVL